MNRKRYGKKWSREETILAFDLYSRTPFGKIHAGNKDIIRLAELIGRTPASVGLKMANLASHDPSLSKRGVVAMQHGSKLDSEIWEEYCNDWESLSYEAKQILNTYEGDNIKETEAVDYTLYPEGITVESTVKERVGQQFFRNAVLNAYSRKCCITGMALSELLIASHIKPWKISDPKTERTNPRNGLCLNSFHDKAFDRGLITIDYSYRIILSPQLKRMAMDDNSRSWLQFYESKTIQLPDKFIPDKLFIEYHNDVVYKR